MKNLWTSKSILVLGISLFANFNCHKQGKEDAFALLTSTEPPVLSSVEPKIGTPSQANIDRIFSATQVVIQGEKFGLSDAKVYFNSIEASVIYNTGTEIRTSVPDGAISGFIYVARPGGVCTQGTKLGINCSGSEFFIDCYSPYNKEYGAELSIEQGSTLDIEFKGVETKAVRVEMPAQAGNVTVGCANPITVKYFSPSCKYTSLTSVTNPVIPVVNSKILQLIVTASDETCTISTL